jgi:hypothetical protein
MIAQPTPEGSRSSETREFPVIMQQNVAAGATPVGTKVHAKLVVATLVDGEVVPRNAVLSGEVTESAARSPTEPSRLAIRMDLGAVEARIGSPPALLDRLVLPHGHDDESGSLLSAAGCRAQPEKLERGGSIPRAELTGDPAVSRPGHRQGSEPGPTHLALVEYFEHRVLMKDVESKRDPDGTVSLTSTRFNLKIDKLTTYVLAAGDLLTN